MSEPDTRAEFAFLAEVAFLEQWARQNGCRFVAEGECGFGRECVGISAGGEWPSYEAFDYETLEATHSCPEAAPPSEVTDAYHKHPCLAVLGRGPDAIHQLYLWVQSLAAHGVVVERRARRGRPIDIFFHGQEEALLVRSGHAD